MYLITYTLGFIYAVLFCVFNLLCFFICFPFFLLTSLHFSFFDIICLPNSCLGFLSYLFKTVQFSLHGGLVASHGFSYEVFSFKEVDLSGARECCGECCGERWDALPYHPSEGNSGSRQLLRILQAESLPL